MAKIYPSNIHDFINKCILIDDMMKKVNNYYMEIGYPVINGFQTDYMNIHEFDLKSKETIDEFEASENYKNIRENIKPEVEIFVERLVDDAKTGTMPFNTTSLKYDTSVRHLIYNCIAMESVDGSFDEKDLDITKKLYDICIEEIQPYKPYISFIIESEMSNFKQKLKQKK